MEFICYEKCSTCKKAKGYLEKHGFQFEIRDIKENNPTKNELQQWIKKSGLEVKRFFNTSGLKYRELGLSERLPRMSEDEKLDLLANDGMLVKRPILITENEVLVGFKEKEWENLK